MITVANKIGIIYLVTRVCLTNAILTAKASLDSTNIPRPWHSYLPATNAPFPKHPNHQYNNHAIDNDPKKLVSSRDLQTERPTELQSVQTFNRKQKSQTGPQRFPTEIQQNDVWLSAKVPSATMSPTSPTTTLSSPRDIRGYQSDVPHRFAYQDIEVLDRYLTDELNDDKLPYRGKTVLSTFHHHGTQDITTAIKTLDLFLRRTLNDDGYNSELHPPPNPVLALFLSRYGRYVPGTRNPRVYAYMATNNMHNYQPFGKYKYEFDEVPIYAAR